jgi:hypothetical protein
MLCHRVTSPATLTSYCSLLNGHVLAGIRQQLWQEEATVPGRGWPQQSQAYEGTVI